MEKYQGPLLGREEHYSRRHRPAFRHFSPGKTAHNISCHTEHRPRQVPSTFYCSSDSITVAAASPGSTKESRGFTIHSLKTRDNMLILSGINVCDRQSSSNHRCIVERSVSDSLFYILQLCSILFPWCLLTVRFSRLHAEKQQLLCFLDFFLQWTMATHLKAIHSHYNQWCCLQIQQSILLLTNCTVTPDTILV